jgi:phenylacetic acid degradation operon negative regulatory protein
VRYQLSRRLASLGWGSVGNSMWLNSGAVPEDAVLSTLHRLGLDERATMMRAEFRPPTRIDGLVERAWDLPALAERYRRFVAEHAGPEPTTDADAFARRAQIVAGFTNSFWTDPRLPAEYLPPDWAGDAAMELVRHAFLDWRVAATRWWSGASLDAGGD